MLLTACLMTGFIGCSDDDPNYDNVTPPAVVVAPNTLTGVITDNQGNPLSDAKCLWMLRRCQPMRKVCSFSAM